MEFRVNWLFAKPIYSSLPTYLVIRPSEICPISQLTWFYHNKLNKKAISLYDSDFLIMYKWRFIIRDASSQFANKLLHKSIVVIMISNDVSDYTKYIVYWAD